MTGKYLFKYKFLCNIYNMNIINSYLLDETERVGRRHKRNEEESRGQGEEMGRKVNGEENNQEKDM